VIRVGQHQPTDPPQTPSERDHVARQRGHDLANLRGHWGEAYEIAWGNGMFGAERRDNHASVSTGTAAQLRRLIREDYSANPVRRELGE